MCVLQLQRALQYLPERCPAGRRNTTSCRPRVCPERADGGWGARALLRGLVHDVLIVHVECTSVDAQRLKARHEKRVEGLLLELIVIIILLLLCPMTLLAVQSHVMARPVVCFIKGCVSTRGRRRLDWQTLLCACHCTRTKKTRTLNSSVRSVPAHASSAQRAPF